MAPSRANPEREQRLAEALRANLHRRKDQARARRTSAPPAEPAPLAPDANPAEVTAPDTAMQDRPARGVEGAPSPA